MEMRQPSRRLRRNGFTLVEILVVIVIILLMLGMAVPVLHVITGSQSEAGAANMIAAMLSRARTDAIGLQKPIGVAFIYNPNTNAQYMAEVEFPNCPEWTAGTPTANGSAVKRTSSTGLAYYFVSNQNNPGVITTAPGFGQQSYGVWQVSYGPPIEMRTDTDLQPLPAGIAVQTICNCSYSNGQRLTDGYLTVGVILFDGLGRLTSQPYGFAGSSQLAISSGLNQAYPAVTNVGIFNSVGNLIQFGVPSQFGLVVYQRNDFVSQGFPTNDPTYFYSTAQASSYYNSSPTGGPTQAQEESWLDQNSTPLLINRYTGTLIRAE